ncbi:spore cortex biosynthesis protein YabQ [Paenibacillus rhizovicinus]|uniref:Spore cortex biosynthesis protein YabQ n=1 Tax=Paenibacillus rhizovicinus TaxID=2704463 RepID=A0A6C0P108_9BACL|nr:spore cortex biosynthesis protein YabQ [Paenibacillus rhizovicinus]QHW32139.1 spore cortex biosynthesis protein YabQ [Paenibacillus rhizovicinus]
MSVSLSVQWWTMMTMLLSGIGMGIVFDGYRVVSDELRISRIWVPVFDLLYWIAATIAVFQVLSSSNHGEVRFYVFLGLILGIGCYYWLFSRITVSLVKLLIRTVRAITGFVIKTFELLIIKPLILFYRLAKLLVAFFRAFTMFLFKIVVQLVRPFWLLLSWMTKPIWKPAFRWWDKRVNPIITKWRVADRLKAGASAAAGLWQRWKNRKDSNKEE